MAVGTLFIKRFLFLVCEQNPQLSSWAHDHDHDPYLAHPKAPFHFNRKRKFSGNRSSGRSNS